ncbi:MAG: phosphatidylserine decarboxylase family protein [Candidatus Marinimicrobia bacterium]|nr:phosphatidylserine decarboxylase family protein [Candidatus Neomarinimicrobiota bacterium]
MALEGIPFVVAAGVLLIALGIAASVTGIGFIWGLSYAEAALLLFIVFFFRDPDRTTPKERGVIVSAADGKVVTVKEVEYPDISAEKLIQVSVFLSIFDVHVNRIPVSGKVREVKYFPGKFMLAWKEKASLENEQTLISIDSEGRTIYLKQIAGLVARRISWQLDAGQSVEAGERFGLIRFGSRVDLLLPTDSRIEVKVGDKVKGGETVIGALSHETD